MPRLPGQHTQRAPPAQQLHARGLQAHAPGPKHALRHAAAAPAHVEGVLHSSGAAMLDSEGPICIMGLAPRSSEPQNAVKRV